MLAISNVYLSSSLSPEQNKLSPFTELTLYWRKHQVNKLIDSESARNLGHNQAGDVWEEHWGEGVIFDSMVLISDIWAGTWLTRGS